MCQRLSKALGSKIISNEAVARCFINLVLIFVLTEEKSLTERFEEMSMSESMKTPSLTPPPPHPASNVPLADIGLFFEVPIKGPVIHDGRYKTVSGIADYTLGYRINTKSLVGNLIVVEAKRKRMIGLAYAQLLVYMGM